MSDSTFRRVLRSGVIGWLFATIASLSGQTPPFQIVTESLPNAAVGVAYSQQIAVSGGSCPATGMATSAIDEGALPAGLAIASPAGVKSWSIQGTPTASGNFQFKIHLRWMHNAVSPFDRDCTDEAVKTLTMTVIAPLRVDRSQISVTYQTGRFPPAAETLQVTSPGTSGISFTAQATTNSGGSWLSVTPQSGLTPAALSVGFAISGLQPSVYTGRVTVGTEVVAVTLTVVATNVVLQVSPSLLFFSYTTGGPVPPAQSLAVTVAGESVIFQASVTSPGWLSINPAGAGTPARLTVIVDPKDLSPGGYLATITLRVTGASNAQTVGVSLLVASPPVLPAITPNGVVNAANLSTAIAPGTWVSIFGSNLSPTTRPWREADFVSGRLPTALDGTSVTINGKAAAVAYISPTQINVLAPDDAATGLVPVQVTSPTGTSANALALQQTAAPALFQFRAGATTYVAGIHADGAYIAGPALVQQGIPGIPAKPGETIVIFGTGFGATQPTISATSPVPAPLPLANPQDLRVRIGGVDAVIEYAGLISPGVYQFNVVVPQVADGDRTIVAELRGLLTRFDLLLSVQR